MAPKAKKRPAAHKAAATETTVLAIADSSCETEVMENNEDDKQEEDNGVQEEEKETKSGEEEEKENEDGTTKPKTAKTNKQNKLYTKPKAKASGKTLKKIMKRPAGKGQDDDDDEKKKETLAAKCEKWQHLGQQGKRRFAEDEEEEGEDDDEDNTEEKRHRGKARKFKKMADSGAIPDHIMQMFEKEASKHPKPRKFKFDLINKLFKEDGNGGYTMCADDPWFQQQKEMLHKKYGRDEQQGTPRDAFAYQVFHGNFEALDAAIQRGSVQQWDQDGVEFCGYRKTKAGVANEKQEATKFGGKQVQLKGSQYQALNKAFKSMSWNFSDPQQNPLPLGNGGGNSSGSGKSKPIENAGLTKKMMETLTEAKNAHEKLHSTAMKLLHKCSCLDDKKEFKATVIALKDWSLKNDNILTWQAWLFCLL